MPEARSFGAAIIALFVLTKCLFSTTQSTLDTERWTNLSQIEQTPQCADLTQIFAFDALLGDF